MHHRLMKQTLYKLQTVCTKYCLHDMTSARELRGINQADLSPGTSVTEDVEAPAQHPPFGLPLSATLSSALRAAVPVDILHNAGL